MVWLVLWRILFVSNRSRETNLRVSFQACPDCVLGHKDYYLKLCGVLVTPAALSQSNMLDFAKLSGPYFFIKNNKIHET